MLSLCVPFVCSRVDSTPSLWLLVNEAVPYMCWHSRRVCCWPLASRLHDCGNVLDWRALAGVFEMCRFVNTCPTVELCQHEKSHCSSESTLPKIALWLYFQGDSKKTCVIEIILKSLASVLLLSEWWLLFSTNGALVHLPKIYWIPVQEAQQISVLRVIDVSAQSSYRKSYCVYSWESVNVEEHAACDLRMK